MSAGNASQNWQSNLLEWLKLGVVSSRVSRRFPAKLFRKVGLKNSSIRFKGSSSLKLVENYSVFVISYSSCSVPSKQNNFRCVNFVNNHLFFKK